MSFLDILSGGLDLLNTGYKAYTNKRDYDYQQNLQQEIFNREDNAVQRRVEDLKAAGLNPALAQGSAAGAGSIVGRSNTDDLGAKMDNLMALNQIRLQKQETENARKTGEILDIKKQQDDFNRNLDFYTTLASLGFDVNPEVKWKDGKASLNLNFTSNNLDSNGYWNIDKPFRNMILGAINSQYNQLMTSEELLNKDAQWYTADKVSGMAFGLLNSLPLNFNISNIKRR